MRKNREIFSVYILLRTDCNYFAVRENYYYVCMLEVVSYDYSTTSDINFMEIEFEKYGK